MNANTVLAGKVLFQSLPLVQDPSAPGVPALKRLLLPQGELAQIYDAEEGIRYMAIIELRPGKPRGNHFHEIKEELVYVMQGEALLLVEDIDSKARDSLALRAGDLAVIQTRVAHALRASAPGQAIEFSKARFDPADIYRYPLEE